MVSQFQELTDSQWEVIKDLFPEQKICTLSLRTVLNAIFLDFKNWKPMAEPG